MIWNRTSNWHWSIHYSCCSTSVCSCFKLLPRCMERKYAV